MPRPPELSNYLARQHFRAALFSIAPRFCASNITVRFSCKQAAKRAGSILVNPALKFCVCHAVKAAQPLSTTGCSHPRIYTSPRRIRRIRPILRIRGHIRGHIRDRIRGRRGIRGIRRGHHGIR